MGLAARRSISRWRRSRRVRSRHNPVIPSARVHPECRCHPECNEGSAGLPYLILAARNGSPHASVARARKPVTLATANDTPDRFRSRGTFGIGLGKGAAVYDGRSSLRGVDVDLVAVQVRVRDDADHAARDFPAATSLRSTRARTRRAHPRAAAYATAGASFSACAGFVVPRLRLINCAPSSAAHWIARTSDVDASSRADDRRSARRSAPRPGSSRESPRRPPCRVRRDRRNRPDRCRRRTIVRRGRRRRADDRRTRRCRAARRSRRGRCGRQTGHR